MQKATKLDASKARITINPPQGKLTRLMFYENDRYHDRVEEQIFIDSERRLYFYATGLGGFNEVTHAEVMRWYLQRKHMADDSYGFLSTLAESGPDFFEMVQDMIPGDIDYTWEIPEDVTTNQSCTDIAQKLAVREAKRNARKWMTGGAK